jgi:hypothetical protein
MGLGHGVGNPRKNEAELYRRKILVRDFGVYGDACGSRRREEVAGVESLAGGEHAVCADPAKPSPDMRRTRRVEKVQSLPRTWSGDSTFSTPCYFYCVTKVVA